MQTGVVGVKKLMFYNYIYTFVIYFEIANRSWLQNTTVCNYVYEICTTVPTFHTGYTYIAT